MNSNQPKNEEKKEVPRIYVIGDTHFGHKMLADKLYRGSGFEEKIIQNWNRSVRPIDIIIHLGDFSLGKYQDYSTNESILMWRNQLNGTIILVRGNHDNNSPEWYMNNGFSFCVDKFEMKFRGKNLIFTHIPVSYPLLNEINIHGHMHGNSHRIEDKPDLYSPGFTHFDVSCECVNYTPVSLQSLLK